ncbi:MAG: AlpA family transcriptional regulator [Oxalobacteraceae bacterium]|nr:AlpA family transcriptional regulator [Oxalobacteraceae bacterium]
MLQQSTKQLWKLPRVMAVTGLSKSSIYRLIKEGKFVSPVKLGVRSVAFDSSAIQTWIDTIIQAGAK